MSSDQLSYYRQRAAEERAAAEKASNEKAANVHQSLAERYAALAGESAPTA